MLVFYKLWVECKLAIFASSLQGLQIYIYIYIYMHAVKSIIGPSLGVFKVNNWAKFVFLNRLCKKTIKIGVSSQFLKLK